MHLQFYTKEHMRFLHLLKGTFITKKYILHKIYKESMNNTCLQIRKLWLS